MDAGRKTLALNGCWTWYNDPRAISIGGVPVIGATTLQAGVDVKRVDAPGVVVRALVEPTSDDHDNPSFLIRASDSRVLVFYSGHNTPDTCMRVSTNPLDVSSWGPEVDLDSFYGVSNYSYTNPVQLPGLPNAPIFNIFRATAPDTHWTPHYSVSLDGADTWSPAVKLIDASGRPYVKVSQTTPTRFDIALSTAHPMNAENVSIKHLYYDGAWRNSAGVDLGQPPFALDALTTVYDAAAHGGINSWNWDVAMLDGAPVILYATFPETTDHRYNFARWTGSEWVSSEICTAGKNLYASETCYSGGMGFDHANPLNVVASRESGDKWAVWKYTAGDAQGSSWSGAQISNSTDKHCIRPVYIRGQVTEPRIAYVTGLYSGYTNFATRVILDSSAP